MRSSRNINFLVPLQVYPFDIMVSIGETDEQLAKSIKKFGLNIDDIDEIVNLPSTVKGRTLMLGTNQTFIRLLNKPKHFFICIARKLIKLFLVKKLENRFCTYRNTIFKKYLERKINLTRF